MIKRASALLLLWCAAPALAANDVLLDRVERLEPRKPQPPPKTWTPAPEPEEPDLTGAEAAEAALWDPTAPEPDSILLPAESSTEIEAPQSATVLTTIDGLKYLDLAFCRTGIAQQLRLVPLWRSSSRLSRHGGPSTSRLPDARIRS